MADSPKYSRVEFERRWLVENPPAIDGPSRRVEDLYIEGGRLRLRKMSGCGETVFKLGKKYGKSSPFGEPVTTIYLDEAEYDALAILPGDFVAKTRVAYEDGSLDLYDGLTVYEIEFTDEDEAKCYRPPTLVGREITGDPEFSGAALARRRALKRL